MLNITSPAFCQRIVITSYRSLGIHQTINSHCNESVTVNKLFKCTSLLHIDLQVMVCVMISF